MGYDSTFLLDISQDRNYKRMTDKHKGLSPFLLTNIIFKKRGFVASILIPIYKESNL